jgi:hypothetical protein
MVWGSRKQFERESRSLESRNGTELRRCRCGTPAGYDPGCVQPHEPNPPNVPRHYSVSTGNPNSCMHRLNAAISASVPT